MRIALLAAFLLLATLAVSGRAQDVFQEGTTITIELQNGDKITGTLEKADQAKLIINHPILGRLEIARASIKPPAPKPAVEPVSPWTSKFDTSLSGSEGNSVTQTFRSELDVTHEDEKSVDAFTLWYRHATADVTINDNNPATDDTHHVTTEGKLFTQLRHEWKPEKDSKWRTFAQGSFERDQLASYEDRLSVAGGAAYAFNDGPVHKVTGRLGAGVSHKYGESDPTVKETSYEALLGFDWAWKISDISDFSFTTDIYPGINPSGELRTITRVGYDRKVSPDSPWYWKFGVDHFYDSAAGAGKKSTDWNYYAGVGRNF